MRAVDLRITNEDLDIVLHAAGLAVVLEAGLQGDGAGRARRHRQPERHRRVAQLLNEALLIQYIHKNSD